MCEGFYLGSQSTASSRKSCKVLIPRGGRRSLALGCHLKYSKKFMSLFWLRIFYCPWGFKLIQGRKREFAFELRVQSAQCELLGDLSSCPAVEFLVISGNSTAKRAQGFYLPVPWDLSGLEHNKAELLSKRRGGFPNSCKQKCSVQCRGCSSVWDVTTVTLPCHSLCWIKHFFKPLEKKSLKWAQISVLSPAFGWPVNVQVVAAVFWSCVCGVVGIGFSQLAFPCFSHSLPRKKQ